MAAFTPATFMPMSSMANSDAPRHYTYVTADSKSDTGGSGYFDSIAETLNVNDLIWIIGASGGTQVFTLTMIDAISAAGVVTVLDSTLTLA